MALKESQKDMMEHSAKKVELLRHYLNAYLAVVGHDSFTERVRCYDLFCGEGIYPNGGEGSPITFIKSLRAFSLKCPEKNFTFHFNDQDANKVQNVHACMDLLGKGPPALTITSSILHFKEVMEATKKQLAALGREKAFIFIDPYGYKEIRPGAIKELMAGGNTEVLLFLPTQHMFRFSQKGTPVALSDFLEELRYGRGFPAGMGVTDYLDYIKDGFRLLMPDCYVDSFTIRKDAQTAFCLFFFTSHIYGAEKMLETKWKLDNDQGKGWSYQDEGIAGGLFDLPQTNPLEKLIEASLASGAKTNEALYESTIHAGFLPTHTTQILTSMQKQGRIHVIPENTRKGAFFLNYQACKAPDLSKRKIITIHLT